MSGKSVKLGCRGRRRAAGLLGAQSKNSREGERSTEGKGSELDSGFADLKDSPHSPPLCLPGFSICVVGARGGIRPPIPRAEVEKHCNWWGRNTELRR